MTRINSHLILTLEQKKNLRSLPDSKFTDKKWESPNDAVPFLKEHGLILENKSERKWKVRYSDKAKGICLLQCCCGSERPKNGNSKARKSRQVYKFVGCLAHARIKKYKNNCINVYGYLIHSEDCQRQTSTNNETEEQIESWRKANDELQPWEEIYEKLNLFDKLMYGGVNDYVTNITNNEEFEN
ncbi:unnamed protein product [Rhizophagus irregularis]|nr:unnamed protein product [Rhizophagus irregularis]